MKVITMIGCGLLASVLAACSAGDDRAQETRLPIVLGTEVGAVTRSNDATNLLSGDTVYVWADMVNGATLAVTEYFNAWALKANGVGSLSTLAAGNAKLFPATNALDFYALVGNFGKKTVEEQQVPWIDAEVSELPTTTGIQHAVLADQKDAEAYYKSDLLYAVRKNQEPVSEAVVLPFKHLLSRIQVVIVAGNGMTAGDLTGATVELLNLKQQVTFKPAKDKDFASQTDLASMLSIPQTATSANIQLKTSVVSTVGDATGTANASVYADAIVVPQTVSAGQFIHVKYLDRDTYYTIPAGDGLKLESGKQYRFRLIADRIGESYELNAITIEEWGPATTPVGVWLD
ncbi:MAG: fimbrillin family protein [Prevotella sp.]|nr:fimbrillin family protein [Prevotella sp.]